MKLIDKIKVKIKAGNGGNGVVSFSRLGAPSGGDGGKGGDIFFDVDKELRTLSYLKSTYLAENGENASHKKPNGKNGEDLIIYLPLNTKIKIDNQKELIIKKRIKILNGAKGGFGNEKITNIYKSKLEKEKWKETKKIYEAEKGEKSKFHIAEMEVELLSEVSLLGKPSAGKSTLISKMTNYNAKVGAYDFTTLEPALAMAVIDQKRRFAMLDLPGIIKGASIGKGHGDQVIEYILKTKIILHIIDFGSKNKKPLDDFEETNNEIFSYSPKLKSIEQIVVANKMDLEGSRIKLKRFKLKYPNIKIIPIVALDSKGTKHLMEYIWKRINES
ncbi:MAG: 50S ribosome-binding GTPase [Mycoplasmatales bacterium]|nr:50S ribosome-binding GTPase [Mycoplasmatales bacterium]